MTAAGNDIGVWNPGESLDSRSTTEEQYSRGFLRCTPTTWFPGLPAQWLPLLQTFSIDPQGIHARPALEVPESFTHSFVASMSGELLGIGIDAESAATVGSLLAPDGLPEASTVVLEYLCRRFVSSAALSWSGVDSSGVKFESGKSLQDVPVEGGIELLCTLNERTFGFWVVGPHEFLTHFDGLWRRQLHSSSPQSHAEFEVTVELARLYIPRDMLLQYTKSGAMVDLGVPLSDSVTLLAAGQPWLQASLRQIGGAFGVEVIPGAPAVEQVPSGSVRMSVAVSKGRWPGTTVVEMAQVGAMLRLPELLSDTLTLAVDNEVVGKGQIKTYQGRFVMTVV